MGYQNRAAEKSGWNLIAGTFKTIGKEKSAMTLADAVGNSLWDPTNDSIQFLDEGGGTRQRGDGYTAEYTYINAEWAAMLSCEVGWYQFQAINNGEGFYPPEDDDDFSYGAGAVVQVGNTEAGLTFSGEVTKGPQTILAAKSGWNIIGNPLPIDLTLADVSGNETWDPTNDSIQFLDEGGGTRIREDGYTAEYTYINAEWAAMLSCEVGWYQFQAINNGEGFYPPEDVDAAVDAGTAFVVQVGNPETGVQFKAALPSDAE